MQENFEIRIITTSSPKSMQILKRHALLKHNAWAPSRAREYLCSSISFWYILTQRISHSCDKACFTYSLRRCCKAGWYNEIFRPKNHKHFRDNLRLSAVKIWGEIKWYPAPWGRTTRGAEFMEDLHNPCPKWWASNLRRNSLWWRDFNRS